MKTVKRYTARREETNNPGLVRVITENPVGETRSKTLSTPVSERELEAIATEHLVRDRNETIISNAIS